MLRVGCMNLSLSLAGSSILSLQIHTALYKHPDFSHSATEINDDAHITVDRMSQCGSWGQFECLCPVSLWNKNSLCTFLMWSGFLPGQEQNIQQWKSTNIHHSCATSIPLHSASWTVPFTFGMFFWKLCLFHLIVSDREWRDIWGGWSKSAGLIWNKDVWITSYSSPKLGHQDDPSYSIILYQIICDRFQKHSIIADYRWGKTWK